MLLINELKFTYRQPLVVFASMAALLMSILLSVASTENGNSVNGLYQIYALLQMLVTPAVIPVIGAALLLRDKNSNMCELIDATPLSYRKRWLYRVLATILVLSIPFIVSWALIVFILAGGQGVNSAIMFLGVSSGVIIPNAMLIACFAFLIAKHSQNSFTLYAFSIGIGVIYIFIGSLLGFSFLAGSSIVSERFYNLMLWLDPFALTALLHYMDANPLTSTEFISNRLVILLCCFCMLIALSRERQGEKGNVDKKASGANVANRKSMFSWLEQRFPGNAFVRLALLNVKIIIGTKLTLPLFVLWTMVAMNEALTGLTVGTRVAGSQVSSVLALNAVSTDVYLVITSACLALWSWLICWNDKRLDFDGITAATPITNSHRLFAEFTGLIIVLGTITALAGVVSLIAELMVNSNIMPLQYIKQLSLAFFPQALLSLLFVCLHHMFKSPIRAGLAIFAVILLKFTPITSTVGLTHLLWNIAGAPIQPSSQYWYHLSSFHVFIPFMLFWVLLVISMTIVAERLSHRGTGFQAESRPVFTLPAMTSFAITAAVGLAIHFQLVVERPLTYSAERENWQSAYEKTFKHYATLPQPDVVEIKSNIELFPEAGHVDAVLHYTLKNSSSVSIPTILFGRHGNAGDWSLQLTSDTGKIGEFTYNQAEIELDHPMRPGDVVTLSTRFSLQQPMLWPNGETLIIKDPFTSIKAKHFLPAVGYQPWFEVADQVTRDRLGLGEHSKPQFAQSGKTQMITTLTTSTDHFVVPVGSLQTNKVETDRKSYTFNDEITLPGDYFWVSLPHEPVLIETNAIPIQFFVPEPDEFTHSIMKTAIKDSVEWINAHISLPNMSELNVVYSPVLQNVTQASFQQLVLKADWAFLFGQSNYHSLSPLQYSRLLRGVTHALRPNLKSRSAGSELITSMILVQVMAHTQGQESINTLLEEVDKVLQVKGNNQQTRLTDRDIADVIEKQSVRLAGSLITDVPQIRINQLIKPYISGKPMASFEADLKQLLQQELIHLNPERRTAIKTEIEQFFRAM